jgi:uncharacterized protein YjbI with pentapeptide repeats
MLFVDTVRTSTKLLQKQVRLLKRLARFQSSFQDSLFQGKAALTRSAKKYHHSDTLFVIMVNEEHLALLQQGVAIWNEWRQSNSWLALAPVLDGANLSNADLHRANLRQVNLRDANLTKANLCKANLERANLSNADLQEADLSMADLRDAILNEASLAFADLQEADLGGTNLGDANLRGAHLGGANLSGANLRDAQFDRANFTGANLSGQNLRGLNFRKHNLSEANLSRTNLREANFSEANLSKANLTEADLDASDLRGLNLSGANLNGANLNGANLNGTQLIRTDLSHADLTGSSIYGVAAWDVKLTSDTRQENLTITPPGEPVITVDNIKVAQFIYLLLNNKEIRDVIDTITSKAVLILGRFSPERKIILDHLREKLRNRGYLPIMFDFEKPKSHDTVETIQTLAGMSKFIIADLTEAKAVVQELQQIVPHLPSVAVRFIIKKSEKEPSMFDHMRRYPWVLAGAFEYENPEEVIGSIEDAIIEPVEAKLRELTQ